MKLILTSTIDERLLKLAGELKTDQDEIKILNDYILNAENKSLIEKINCYGEIAIISGVNFGNVNSQVVWFFDLLKEQNLPLNIKLSIYLVAENENIELAKMFIKRACDGLKIDLKKIELVDSNKNISDGVNTCLDGKNQVIIYTDGACSGNPGAGGWGAVLIHGEKQKEISGYEAETTNNKMELTAVIKALSMLKQPCSVELYSDSAYVVNSILQGWLENWKKNNWLGADKKPVKNQELWLELDRLLEIHSVHFNKVKGHADNELNNRCDYLATNEIAKNQNNV